MLYLRVERYIILSVIALLCIANAAITTLFFFPQKVDELSVSKAILFFVLLPIILTVISKIIYTRQMRAKTIAFVEFDMEKDRRKHVISIMFLCSVFLNTQLSIYIYINH